MRVFAHVWRHTSIFFVSQLVILLCGGLYFIQWSYTATQPTLPEPTAAMQNPASITLRSGITAMPIAHTWTAALGVLRQFVGIALLILVGSSALFVACQMLRLESPTDTP